MKHIVGFSGGIDSQATARWVLNRYPKDDVILLNTQAGRNEHPITVAFVAQYSATVHPVIEVVPLILDLGGRGTKEGATRDRRQEFADTDELTFDRLAYIKGRFPSRKAQFCTEHLKLAPQRRWVEANCPDGNYIRYVGVRRDESQTRANCSITDFDDYFDCDIIRPIADWTKEMCFAYVKAHGEEFNPLYLLGFSRVGCAPASTAGKTTS